VPEDAPSHAEFARRAAAISKETRSTDLLAEGKAFLELDRKTNCVYLKECARLDGDTQAGRLAQGIETTTRHLMARILLRASSGHEGAAQLRLRGPARDTLAAVELAFRQALQAGFAVPGGTGSVPFERAFIDYSSGQLRVTDAEMGPTSPGEVHGAPNGCYHLAFAESALLFIEEGIEPEFWSALLPTLIRGSAAFVQTHWDGSGRTRKDYVPPKGAPASTVATRVELEHEFANFDELVRFALADEHHAIRPAHRAGGKPGCAEVLVEGGFFVESESNPGTYDPVGASDLEGEEIATFMNILVGSYVEYSANPDEQSQLILEHLGALGEVLGLDGVLVFEEAVYSRQDSNGWDPMCSAAAVPYEPPSGSNLSPTAHYFVNAWLVF
jgi:hypothetical protein